MKTLVKTKTDPTSSLAKSISIPFVRDGDRSLACARSRAAPLPACRGAGQGRAHQACRRGVCRVFGPRTSKRMWRADGMRGELRNRGRLWLTRVCLATVQFSVWRRGRGRASRVQSLCLSGRGPGPGYAAAGLHSLRRARARALLGWGQHPRWRAPASRLADGASVAVCAFRFRIWRSCRVRHRARRPRIR